MAVPCFHSEAQILETTEINKLFFSLYALSITETSFEALKTSSERKGVKQ